MGKRILLIDSDETFAHGLQDAMNARGFLATTATNSEQGMTLARTESPDLIVVCVEAQPTNGYMLCTRLKKDEQLKGIPVILTSANATPDSFEKHKKLKTRAEEYLIKPFEPRVMIEKASALLGMQPPDEQEEILTVHEELHDEPLGLGDLVHGEDEPISLSEHDAAQAHSADVGEDALVVEEVEEVSLDSGPVAAASSEDEDLEMFDKAFDSLGAPPAPTDQTGNLGLRLAPEPPPESHEPEPEHQPTELSAPDDDAVLHGLIGEGELTGESTLPAEGNEHLEARITELTQLLAEREAELEQARRSAGSSNETIKLKEARTRADKEVLRLKEELNAKEHELLELQEQHTTLESQAQQLRDDATRREVAAKALQQRADALAAAAKKFERELTSAREEAKQAAALKAKVADVEKLQAAHEELKQRHDAVAAEVETHKERASSLETELAGAREMHAEELEAARAEAGKLKDAHEGELTRLRAELEAARNELETVRTDLAALTGEKDLLSEEREELRKQLAEAQAASAQNEDRAVKAYQRIKSDEKLREKTRKALQIALQLLEEGQPQPVDGGVEAEKQSA